MPAQDSQRWQCPGSGSSLEPCVTITLLNGADDMLLETHSRRDTAGPAAARLPCAYLASTSVETRPGIFFSISAPKSTKSLSIAF